MPQTIKDADGNDIEVFTQEEVDAAAEEKARLEAERVESEKQTELDALAAEKQELEEKLQKEQEKEKNFEKVRRKAEGKDIEINEELKKQIDELNKRIDSVAQRPVDDTKAEFIKARVGEEKEKIDKFEYYYKRLGADAKSKEEVLKAANEALVLATGGEYKPSMDGQMFSVGASQNYRQQKTEQVSEESKAIGNLLGITAEDRKKYGKKGNT